MVKCACVKYRASQQRASSDRVERERSAKWAELERCCLYELVRFASGSVGSGQVNGSGVCVCGAVVVGGGEGGDMNGNCSIINVWCRRAGELEKMVSLRRRVVIKIEMTAPPTWSLIHANRERRK